jgi:hypothetical protein
MKKAGAVHVCETRTGMDQSPDRVGYRHPAPGQTIYDIQEGRPLEIVQQQEGKPLVLPTPKYPNNIGMMESA